MSKCKYWNEEHQDCSISYDEIRAEVIEELKNKADCKNSDCYACAMADGDMNCMLGLLELDED